MKRLCTKFSGVFIVKSAVMHELLFISWWNNRNNASNVWLCVQSLWTIKLQFYVYYSASQKKRNRELSMFYHNLITLMINKWHIFGKLRVSSFIWCKSYDAYSTHEWLKAIWREETKKSFGGRYLNFKEKTTFLESSISTLSYDTSIRKNEPGITKFRLFKVMLAFP